MAKIVENYIISFQFPSGHQRAYKPSYVKWLIIVLVNKFKYPTGYLMWSAV